MSRKGKFIKKESRLVVAQSWEGMGIKLKGMRFLFEVMKMF